MTEDDNTRDAHLFHLFFSHAAGPPAFLYSMVMVFFFLLSIVSRHSHSSAASETSGLVTKHEAPECSRGSSLLGSGLKT